MSTVDTLIYTETTAITIVDTSTELNETHYDISFRAEYDVNGNIQIQYMHDFPGTLTFSTATIVWTDFGTTPV